MVSGNELRTSSTRDDLCNGYPRATSMRLLHTGKQDLTDVGHSPTVPCMTSIDLEPPDMSVIRREIKVKPES